MIWFVLDLQALREPDVKTMSTPWSVTDSKFPAMVVLVDQNTFASAVSCNYKISMQINGLFEWFLKTLLLNRCESGLGPSMTFSFI
jgi:hypothetical protein